MCPVCRSILTRSRGLVVVFAMIPAKPPQNILLDTFSVLDVASAGEDDTSVEDDKDEAVAGVGEVRVRLAMVKEQ